MNTLINIRKKAGVNTVKVHSTKMGQPVFKILAIAIAWVCLLTPAEINTADILFFFVAGSYSHKVGIWPLVNGLAERGHNVTYLSPYEKQPFKVNGSLNDIFLKTHVKYTEQERKVDRLGLRRAGNSKEFWRFEDPAAFCRDLVENPTGDPVIDYLVHRAKFDLVVVNSVFGECGFVLNQQYKAKLILSSSSFFMPWYSVAHGYPIESSWVPEIMEIFQFPMSLKQRLWNAVIPYLTYYFRIKWSEDHNEMIRKTYKTNDFKPTAEQELDVSLMLVNNHFGSTDLARSVPPFVVGIGGMQCWLPKKKLAEKYQQYLDEATNGAILMTFGSATDLSDTPDYFKSFMFTAFAAFPDVKFIIKWTGEMPHDAPKNVLGSSWIPQFEILGHPNIKAFITHGGGNGFMEAVYYGVPLVVMPLYADQDYNAYVIEATEVGVRLELETLVAQDLIDGISTVLREDKYSTNMKVRSEMFRHRPMDPISSAVFWTEFVLRHNDTSSMKPLRHLNWFQQNLLDVYFVLWLGVSLVLAFIIWLLCLTVKLVFAIITKKKARPATPAKKKLKKK